MRGQKYSGSTCCLYPRSKHHTLTWFLCKTQSHTHTHTNTHTHTRTHSHIHTHTRTHTHTHMHTYTHTNTHKDCAFDSKHQLLFLGVLSMQALELEQVHCLLYYRQIGPSTHIIDSECNPEGEGQGDPAPGCQHQLLPS